MSNGGDGPRVLVDGAADEHGPGRIPGALLLILVGLVVGLAFGVFSARSRDASDPPGEFPLATTLAVSTTTAPTTATDPASTIERYEAWVDELESSLADAQQQVLELGLEVDPQRFAMALGCDESIGSQYPSDWRSESFFVGPIAFYRLTERLPAPGWDEVFAIVEASDSVTMVVPASERAHYSLIWDPAAWRDAAGYSVTDGGPAITLAACDRAATVFIGGFVADQAYCAPLDLYFGHSTEPVRVILPFGGVDCPDGSVPLARPEPGPIPDVTGLTVREARLRLRLVGIDPIGEDGHLPDNLVWAQEPNDGSTYEPGTIVGLRTCQPADLVVATYQERLAGTGITFSQPWMARSLDPDMDSWYFLSALVVGGNTDGRIATWGLPSFTPGSEVDSINTPGLSIPANDVAQGFEFGTRQLAPEDYGLTDWLELDGAIASQRCVELSESG